MPALLQPGVTERVQSHVLGDSSGLAGGAVQTIDGGSGGAGDGPLFHRDINFSTGGNGRSPGEPPGCNP